MIFIFLTCKRNTIFAFFPRLSHQWHHRLFIAPFSAPCLLVALPSPAGLSLTSIEPLSNFMKIHSVVIEFLCEYMSTDRLFTHWVACVEN